MMRWLCWCQEQDTKDINVNSRHIDHTSISTSEQYKLYTENNIQQDSMDRPHVETVDSPTIREYMQHMRSTTLASDMQEVLSQEVGKPVFQNQKPSSTKSKSITTRPFTSPVRTVSSHRIGSLYRSQSSPDFDDSDAQSLVKISIPPRSYGIVLRPNTSTPVIVDGFKPLQDRRTSSSHPRAIEPSEEVAPGSILVSIQGVSVLTMDYDDIVAMLQDAEQRPTTYQFQTYTAD